MAGILEGKNAVVTGAGNGIGREIALAFAAEGARVIVNDPGVNREGQGGSAAPANDVAQLIKDQGGMAVANYESVADHAAAESIIEACIDSFGRIDILVNAAGILRERMLWNLTEDDWDAVLSVHLKGNFNCTKFACIKMKEQKSGRIINITSDFWRGGVGQANYAAAKGGIVSLTRAAAREMLNYGVTCNAVAPMAATRMTMDEATKRRWKKRLDDGLIKKQKYDQLMDMAGPEYIPPVVVYLASDVAANISGKVFGCYAGQITIYSEPEPVKYIYRDHKTEGPWDPEVLLKLIPNTLAAGLTTLTAAVPTR
ncbi:SDR family NAD(P)-dependent oxidoreductase [Chloroflexota bacterium]